MNNQEKLIKDMTEHIPENEVKAFTKMLEASSEISVDNSVSLIATLFMFVIATRTTEKNQSIAAAMLLREMANELDLKLFNKPSVHNSKHMAEVLSQLVQEHNVHNALPAFFTILNSLIKRTPADMQEGISKSIELLSQSNTRKSNDTKH